MGTGIGRPEQRILEAVNLFEQLTAEQLARFLGYSFRYTQARCKALSDQKYLKRLTLPKRTQAGGVPYVYTLARKGRQYLHQVMAVSPTPRRYRPSEQQARYRTLAVSEVQLQITKLTEADSTISLARSIPEREFRESPIKASLPDEGGRETVSLIPDLWLHLKHTDKSKTYSYFFCIEVNLTAVEQKRWRKKVSMYLNSQESYTQRVGTDLFQVVTLVLSPETVLRRGDGKLSAQEQQNRTEALKEAEKRKNDYLLWTEAELKAQNRERDSDLFVFSSEPIDNVTPHEFVFSEHFAMPFDPEPISLIPVE